MRKGAASAALAVLLVLIVACSSQAAVRPHRPKPAPTVTVTPTPTPTPGSVIFQDDFSSGNFTRWRSCQWKASSVVRNDNCQTYSGTGEYPAQVIDGAARFEIRDGDSPFSGTERAEIAEPPADVLPGDERLISWDMKFDADFPVPTGDWFIVQQWHGNADGTSPPLALQVGADDVIYLQNQDGWAQNPPTTWSMPVQPVQRGIWQHWEMHVKFSDNPAVGFVELSVDGVQKIAQTPHRTMVAGDTGNYFKTGIYRDPVDTATAILWHDNVVITRP